MAGYWESSQYSFLVSSVQLCAHKVEKCPYVGSLHTTVKLLKKWWLCLWGIDEVKLRLNLWVRHDI